MHQNLLEGLVNPRLLAPLLAFLIQEGWRWGSGTENFHFIKFPGNGSDGAPLWIIFLAPLPYRFLCGSQFSQLKQQSDEAQS